jgi:hypothetical protein
MFFCLNHNRTRESMMLVVKIQNLRCLLDINKDLRTMTRWLRKTFTREILVSDRMSQVISLNHVSKTNSHNVNR